MWKISGPVTLVYSLVLLLATHLSAQHASNFGTVPLYFEENRGQTNLQAKYIARSPNLVGFVLQDGWTLSLQGQAISMHIAGANAKAALVPEGSAQGITNYYLGSRAITNLPHYSSIRARNIRPGIDIVYHGSERELEYDLVIHPGADVAALRLRFEGSQPALANNGDIVLKTSNGEVRQHKPRVWQGATELQCRYELKESGEVGFALSSFERAAELTIDPVISYSTYLSGSNSDNPAGIAVDGSGYAYITGVTSSADFPVTSGTYQGTDVFVTKLNPAGTGLVYSTFIGGTAQDIARGIAIDNAGNVYVTGSTNSANFPVTVNTFTQGLHAFALKLGSAGNLVYSTALAGNNTDIGIAIATDASGSAYVVGTTSSTTFPVTPGSYKTAPGGGGDAFVAKLILNGQISYATYLGGSASDSAMAIAVDASGNAFVGGITSSSNFPTTVGAYATAFAGNQDAFVIKLNPSGSSLVYATFLGGSSTDALNGLAIDAAGNCYVTGATQSVDFPITAGAFSTIKGSGSFNNSGFVTKLNATGTSLVYSTFLGGTGNDSAVGIAVDSNGAAYVTGPSQSTNFPTTPGALKAMSTNNFCCDPDMFLVRVAVDGSALSYSTLLGSSGTESAYALAIDGIGGVYVAGVSQSLIYPTTAGAYQTSSPKNSSSPFTLSVVISKIDFNVAAQCNPNVAPSSQNLPGRGGAISFNLTLSPGCPWEAVLSNTNSLILNNPKYGVVSASPILITGTVPQNPNTFSGITQTVRIGTATYTINQDAGSCQDPVISPLSLAFDSSGGIRNMSLTLPSNCNWTAVPGAPWLSATNNPSGTGPATITIFARQNSFSARSTTLTIAGKSINVTQSGSTCTATATISVSSTSSQGSDGVASITTNSSACLWNAYATVPWIQLNNLANTGQGSGFVPFIIAANPGTSPRTGQILIADVILSVTQDAGPAGTISSYSTSIIAGGGGSSTPNLGDGGPALGAYLNSPSGLAFDPATSNLYIVDTYSRVRVVTPDGNINTFAGGGSGTGENIPATSARLSNMAAVAVDGSSAVYVTDSGSRVRKISQGNIVTLAGGISTGFSGDNGPATNALLSSPYGLAADSTANVYIGDYGNNRVRKVSGGTITTFAGGGNNGLGDGGPATAATLSSPYGVALDPAGNLVIAEDTYAGRVRKAALGNITTVAGGGNGGDGGLATGATLSYPATITVDSLGGIFVLEAGNGRIRKVSVDGTINTITINFSALGLTADKSGNVYYSDNVYGFVRKLTALPSFCTYSVSTPAAIPQSGGSVQISITTAAGCNWGALLIPAWLTPTGATSGIGNGTLTFTTSPNPGAPRSATLAIAGMAIQVTQAGGMTASLSVNRSILNFEQSFMGLTTSPQTVTLSFSGGGGVPWTATSDQSRIVVSHGSGTGNGSFQVSINNDPYTLLHVDGIITVTAPGATGSPKQIAVHFIVSGIGIPIGSFDTPVDNTTGVAGAIPVTGWALDPIEISKVDIWREPVGSEPAGALIYIGDAVFVDGARPDVEAVRQFYPFSYRAGWGYQLLTNFLPQGNGTFKLHAIAHSSTGPSLDLGTKTIMVDNLHAAKPFGTIDTPGQGGTASGNAFVNFGWALTQNPNKIPIDGSTISVVIDGQVVGHPTYNQFRSDIASLFPGYMNSNGAVGFFYIDTTSLSSGVHTISWNVFDNVGHGDGIGSRYFSVFNSGGGSVAALEEIGNPLPYGRGSETLLEIDQLGLVELPVGAISGYQLLNGERRPLPIGSSLNRGVFYWQPGPGFLGEYHLVFEHPDGRESHARVKILPKTYPRGL